MKSTEFCPNCSQMRPVHSESRLETYKVRGDQIEAEHSFYTCDVCGEVFSTADQVDQGLKRSFEIYRKKHQVISPEQIVELRQKYGASQKAFGTILGFGELTINSYEQGSLPSEAHLKVLEMASDPVKFGQMYGKTRSLLGPTQQKRIDEALSNQPKPTTEILYSYSKIDELADIVGESPTAYSGWTKPQPNRLIALIAAIVHFMKVPIYKTKLLKLMFYADFSYFRLTTHSISGWQYARLPYGLVPNDYELILWQIVKDGVVNMTADKEELGDLLSKGNCDMTKIERTLNPDEIEAIRTVCEKLGKLSAKQLSDLTHREDAWLKNGNAKVISYEHALTLKAL